MVRLATIFSENLSVMKKNAQEQKVNTFYYYKILFYTKIIIINIYLSTSWHFDKPLGPQGYI